MTEQWLPIPDYDGWYDVSDQGRVRSWKRWIVRGRGHCDRSLVRDAEPHLLTSWPHVTSGYVAVAINGEKRHVQRLVLLAFRGPCPEHCRGYHLNRTRHDNRLENLVWRDRRCPVKS